MGGVLGGLTGSLKGAAKGGAFGACFLGCATSLWNLWAKQKNTQKFLVTNTVTQLDQEQMISYYNTKPSVCLFPGTKADLVGEYVSVTPDARPPMQRAARVQDKLTLQCWEVTSHFEQRHVVVNGDLLGECVSELYNKSPEAIAAGIQAKTANVCHYNASAILQAATNRDTNYLSRVFLGNM